MGIQKTITDEKGLTANYFRILIYSCVYTIDKQSVDVNLAGYVDANYRELEKVDSVKRYIMNIPVSLTLYNDDTYTREQIYADIMALPKWVDSVAV
jgi:hypothetical protein